VGSILVLRKIVSIASSTEIYKIYYSLSLSLFLFHSVIPFCIEIVFLFPLLHGDDGVHESENENENGRDHGGDGGGMSFEWEEWW
jgi:hypothetical protein